MPRLRDRARRPGSRRRSGARYALAPGLGPRALVDPRHRDAAVDRAHERAQVAAHALVLVHDRRLARARDHGLDALVRAVLAGDVAQIAVDALGRIDARYDLVVEIEVAPVGDLVLEHAGELAHRRVAALAHPGA